jgi:hypothetical protein
MKVLRMINVIFIIDKQVMEFSKYKHDQTSLSSDQTKLPDRISWHLGTSQEKKSTSWYNIKLIFISYVAQIGGEAMYGFSTSALEVGYKTVTKGGGVWKPTKSVLYLIKFPKDVYIFLNHKCVLPKPFLTIVIIIKDVY